MDDDAPPDPDRLADALAKWTRGSLEARELEAFTELTGLRSVARHVQGDSARLRALGFQELLKEAIAKLEDPTQQEAASRIFGLVLGTRALIWGEREHRAAQALHMTRDAFRRRTPERPRSHGDRLITAVAEKIVLMELEYLDRQRWQARRQRLSGVGYEPTKERLDLHIVIAGHVYGTAANLKAVVEIRAREPEAPRTRWLDYLETALWDYVRFSRAEQHYVDVFSNRWGLARDDAAKELVSLLHLIDLDQPFSYTDQSWLRVQVSAIAQEEQWLFLEHLRSSPDGLRALDAWAAWATACTCNPLEPLPNCKVHRAIRSGLRAYDLLNEELHTADDLAKEAGA